MPPDEVRLKEFDTERLWRLATRLGRVGFGALVVLIAHVVVVAIAAPLGFYLHQVFLSLAVGEGILLLACVGAAVTLGVRQRRGLGTGLFVGWAAGYVGLIAAVVAFFVALFALALILLIGWILVWTIGALVYWIFGS